MDATDNRRIMQEVFAELARGNGKPFVGRMADDRAVVRPCPSDPRRAPRATEVGSSLARGRRAR